MTDRRWSWPLRVVAAPILLLLFLGSDDCGSSSRDLSVGWGDFESIGDDPLMATCPGLVAQFNKRHPLVVADALSAESEHMFVESGSPFYGRVRTWSAGLSTRSDVQIRSAKLQQRDPPTGDESADVGSAIFSKEHLNLTIEFSRQFVFSSEDGRVVLTFVIDADDEPLEGAEVLDLSSLMGEEFILYVLVSELRVVEAGGLKVDTVMMADLIEKTVVDLIQVFAREADVAEIDYLNTYSTCLDRIMSCPEGTIALSNPLPVSSDAEHNEFFCEKGELFRNRASLDQMAERDLLFHGPWMRIASSSLSFTGSAILGRRLLDGSYEDGQKRGRWTVRDSGGNIISEAVLIPIASNEKPNASRRGFARPDPEEGMVYIQSSSFYAGCNPAREGDCKDKSLRQKVLLSSFFIDRHEVTRDEYQACVVASGCEAVDGFHGGDQPMTGLTAVQAHAYCQHKGRRLPTEFEWEMAARGGCEYYSDCGLETRMYTWGDARPSADMVRLHDGPAESLEYFEPGPPGQYPTDRSPYGVLDLTGNAQEMVHRSRDTGEHNAFLSDCEDGSCPMESPVVKGLARNDTSRTISSRSEWYASYFDEWVGFRCARSPGAARTPQPVKGEQVLRSRQSQ